MKNIFAAFGLSFLLASSALAGTIPSASNDVTDLATKIGTCEAADTIYVNVQETTLGTLKALEDAIPTNQLTQYRIIEAFLENITAIQRIQMDALIATTPDLESVITKDDKNIFIKTRANAYNTTITALVGGIITVDTNRLKYSATLNNLVNDCDEEYPVGHK
jgi:hypothetical protein